MTTVPVRGTIAPGDYAWVYDMLGLTCTTPEQFKAQLEAAEDDVVVEINSPGGVVTAAAEICEAIRSYAGNIECRVVGQAASAASVIACSAKSSITPMGTLFLHNCIGAAEGNHNAMREAAQAMESIDENIMSVYRAKTGMTDSQIYRLMERNTTISAAKAVELGFIDRITESAADVIQSNSGVVSGLAAGAPGFIDPMAMDADRLAAMRELYDKSRQASCEGGETTMEIEDIRDVDEQVIEAEEALEEPTTAEADADEAAGGDQGENAAEGEGAGDAEASDEGDEDEDEAEGQDGEDAEQAAYDRGVLAERERIAGIMDIAARVPDAMVRAALFTEPVSAEQLALQAMLAEDAQRTGYMDKARADVKASNSAEVAAEVADAPGSDAKAEQKQALQKALAEKFSK